MPLKVLQKIFCYLEEQIELFSRHRFYDKLLVLSEKEEGPTLATVVRRLKMPGLIIRLEDLFLVVRSLQ